MTSCIHIALGCHLFSTLADVAATSAPSSKFRPVLAAAAGAVLPYGRRSATIRHGLSQTGRRLV